MVTDYLCDFIERNQDRPFLGYYPMILPHDPFRPTPDSENPKSKDGNSNYQDMVTYVDKMVGKIVNKLDELGLRENTLVLFTCDNGTSGAIKSELNGKMVQGGKRQMTDAGTHVPLIANWPKTIPGKQVKEDLVDFSDFLPTLLGCGPISSTYKPHFGWTEFSSPNYWQARKPQKMGALLLSQGKRESPTMDPNPKVQTLQDR